MKLFYKILIVFFILLFVSAFVYLPAHNTKIGLEILNNKAEASVLVAAAITLAAVVLILMTWAIINPDFQEKLTGDISAVIDQFMLGIDNISYLAVQLYNYIEPYAVNFLNWLTIHKEDMNVVLPYLNSLSDLEFDSVYPALVAWFNGELTMPSADVFSSVFEWTSELGQNSANIYGSLESMDIDTITYADFTSGVNGQKMPIVNIDLMTYSYRTVTQNATSLNLDPMVIIDYGAFEVLQKYRNADNTLIYPVSSGNVLEAESTYHTTNTLTICLTDTLFIHLNCYWTATQTYFMYFVEDTVAGTYKLINTDFTNYSYDLHWYNTFGSNTSGTDRYAYLSLIGYSANVGKYFLYVYVVDTALNIIEKIRRLPLNDTPTELSRFDNSTSMINDYTVEDYEANSIDVLPTDIPLDQSIDEIFLDAGIGYDIDTNTLTLTLEQLQALLEGSIVEAMSDVSIDVNVDTTFDYDPDIPDEVSKYRLPNLVIQKFPFCLPWDLIALINLLVAPEPQELTIDLSFDFAFENMSINFPFIIDLELIGVSRVAAVMRWIELMAWIVFLIKQTRKLMLA